MAGQRGALEAIADRVEARRRSAGKEIATADVGSFVMEELKKLDKVAYVRLRRKIGTFATSTSRGRARLLNPGRNEDRR
jgi:transcriptional regulator NrdR family protein